MKTDFESPKAEEKWWDELVSDLQDPERKKQIIERTLGQIEQALEQNKKQAERHKLLAEAMLAEEQQKTAEIALEAERAKQQIAADRLRQMQANLDNSTAESIDVPGGKDEEMRHRGTFTAADGKPHTVTADSANELVQKVYNLALSLPTSTTAQAEKPTLTVGEYARRWIELQKESLKASGWGSKQETHLNKHILPLIGHQDISRITNSDIKSAITKMKKPNGKPYAKSYYSAILGTINTMFNQAVADGVISRSPMDGGKRFKNPGVSVIKEDEDRLTDAEVTAIYAEILPKVPPEEKMVRLFLACAPIMGLRRQEWAALTWENVVDLFGDKPRFYIAQKVVYNGEAGNIGDLQPGAKTESGIRWEYIPEIALPFVREAMPENPHGFVLRGRRYNPDGETWISENAFDYLVQQATSYLPEATRERIKKLTAHKGRRTFTDTGRRAGVDSRVIGANAGHSPRDIHAVTEGVYMRISEDEKAQGQQKISDYLTAKVRETEKHG